MEVEKTKFKEINNILQQAGYQTFKSIGKGAFGQVLVATRVNDGSSYAIKVMNKSMVRSKPYLKKYITQQINIMKQLNHPNIVRLYDSFQTNDFIILIMEYCKQGNLLSYQARLPNRNFALNVAIHIILHILLGLKYIHQNGFIHRDIKSENILIKIQPIAQNQFSQIYKIADFGFARPIGKIGARTQCGTQKYMAPEILNNESYGISVDLWALGVLLYFMLFTEYPFQGHDMKSDIRRKCYPQFNINNVISRSQKLKDIPQQVKDFFKKVFVIDYRKRLPFSHILYHPLFSFVRQYTQFADYQKVYQEIQRVPKYIKDQIHKIPEHEHQSETQPEDEGRAILLQRIKGYNYNNSSPEQRILQQLNFEVNKVLYLKQCAYQMYQNYSTYLTYAERLGSKFYLLRTFLFFCEPLLKRLQAKQMPQGFSQVKITPKQWQECTKSEQYKKIIVKLQDEHLKNSFAYEDTFVLIQSIIHQMPIKGFEKGYKLEITEKDFNEFKFGYRSVTVHLFKVIQNCKDINTHLQNKIKMRIFCCHMIKRIFIRSNIEKNFPFFVKWLSRNKIKYPHQFDFTYFKRWILQQQSDNLNENIQILHKNL